MPLRPATPSDIAPASACLTRAFFDEELFGVLIHPHRNAHPTDMPLFFERIFREELALGPANDHHLIVSYATDPTTGAETHVTGLAHWIRKRATPPPLSAETQTALDAARAQNAADAKTHPNRAADPAKLDILSRADPFAAHHWSGPRAESWYLALLGVDPAAGGKGHGKALAMWGLKRAREEGCTASLIAAAGKEGFYHAVGYGVRAGRAQDVEVIDGVRNPFESLVGGTVLFWEGDAQVNGKSVGG